ncbi:pyridoxal kinase PdxY [Pseudorhodoplanes sinuspersici]|uniref:pyridoxal kinase n=1 Tax=Pseudorhodoplanes sinuspersici TaxID=1235591 RepID=A0A1W7A036_9HYPH|nr:pyridoxal kinase PdxY [Pseudorhodoplanes sinuspersici]ARQ02972.1 pyridoxal kinase [Pseudorhodoplanes sinuspersici]
MNILSIQSHVAYGHVGNAAAVFPLQRIGVEVWPVNTVQFSNHTGYGAWAGEVFGADHIREVVQGIEDRGVLSGCDGVLSGYMGSAEIGEAILDAVARVKRANPAARYCCDPVIGDVDTGIYVREGIPEFIRNKALVMADVATPNQFELGLLSGLDTGIVDGLLAAIDWLHALGIGSLLVTSVQTDETPDHCIEIMASGRDGAFRLRTPLLPISVNGAGDAVAALFFAHLMRGMATADALAKAGSSLFGVLKMTAEREAREILLVEAQEEFVKPSTLFEPVKVG